MIISIILGIIIFGYAFWTLYNSIRKSKNGTCSGCEIVDNCNANCKPSVKSNK